MIRSPLTAHRAVPPAPPDRGKLWLDSEISDAFFKGLPGIKNKLNWVRRRFPRESRIQLGRHAAWYESDIRAFIESLRGRIAKSPSGRGKA